VCRAPLRRARNTKEDFDQGMFLIRSPRSSHGCFDPAVWLAGLLAAAMRFEAVCLLYDEAVDLRAAGPKTRDSLLQNAASSSLVSIKLPSTASSRARFEPSISRPYSQRSARRSVSAAIGRACWPG